MNGFLASILGFLNAFIALFLIIGGGAVGLQLDDKFSGGGLIVGLIIGVVLAVIICGVLAIFISMRRELMVIRRLLEERLSEPSENRREPFFGGDAPKEAADKIERQIDQLKKLRSEKENSE